MSLSYYALRQRVEGLPLIRPILERLYEERFSGDCYACFRGVFDNFQQAALSAPKTKPVGFSAGYALEHAERRTSIFSCDYPVIFWLKCLLAENCTMFDFGGHIGGQFYAFSRYLTYPPGFTWLVFDLPEMTTAGEELARTEAATGLRFTNRLEEADGADIFMAAGAIHYFEAPRLPQILESFQKKPAHLLLNKVPLYDGEQFVTLQNSGVGYHPLYVFNREQFIGSLARLRYQLVDMWRDESRPGYIPIHTERTFHCHSGLYLRLAADTHSGVAPGAP